MIVAILGLFDIIAGITVLYSLKFLTGYLAYIVFFKGLISTVSSVATGHYFEWMGIVDLIAGTFLGLQSIGIHSGIFTTIGWLILLKGVYSLFRDVFKV